MRKLSQINEIFSSSMKRNIEGVNKREDEIRINPVDMGCSVLWADKDFMIHNDEFFTIDEAMNIKEGWRLPNLNDLKELASKTKFEDTNDTFILTNEYNTLIFEKKGFFYHVINKPFDVGTFYYGWTSDEFNKDNQHIFTFDHANFLFSPSIKSNAFDSITQSKQDKLCVRLVKDK